MRTDRSPELRRGFTLLEMMAVCALLSLLLLMLPPRLDSFGSRSRLESGANTVLSAFTGAREQAIIDGHEVLLQFDLGDLRDRKKPGRFRYVVVNRVNEDGNDSEDGTQAVAREKRPEEEMIPTVWHDMPQGVILAGFSTDREQWTRQNAIDQYLSVKYAADGSVHPACAIRLESVDLSKEVERTMTVLVNALSGRATLDEGETELPPTRDASDFR